MNKRKSSGAKKLRAKGSHTAVSNPSFHSNIIEKYSRKKKLSSFPFLLFGENSKERAIQGNRFSFPIHIQVLKYPVFRGTVSRELTKGKITSSNQPTSNQPLKPALLKEKEIFRTHGNISSARDIIRQNTRDIVQRRESVIQKTVYNIQKEIRTLSRNENFYPVSGLLTDANLINIVRKNATEDLLRNPIVARMVENSIFRPYAFYQAKRSLKTIYQTYSGNESFGKSIGTSSSTSKVMSNLSRTHLKNVNSGITLPDRNSVSAFDEGLVLDSSSEKETYRQAPGLVFNSSVNLSQELEREMESIKEELAQAEKAAEENYSSIYSRMEEELKRNLEINRISEQVMQQITMRLKIEKERRGLL